MPELISTNPRHSDSLGYSRSKWVAESICDAYHKKYVCEVSENDSIAVLRIGQLTGDLENGIWNMNEAWPLMLSTTKELKCLPEIHEPLTWLPVDIVAKAIVEIAMAADVAVASTMQKEDQVCPVYHLVRNPPETTGNYRTPYWRDLWYFLECRGVKVEVVDPEIWLERLEKLESHPAKALLGLWRRAYSKDALESSRSKKAPSFNMRNTQTVAKIMRDIPEVDRALLGKIWVWLDKNI